MGRKCWRIHSIGCWKLFKWYKKNILKIVENLDKIDFVNHKEKIVLGTKEEDLAILEYDISYDLKEKKFTQLKIPDMASLNRIFNYFQD